MDDDRNTSMVRQAACFPQQTAEECPAMVERAGSAAKFAWEEFVYGRLRNAGTRRAYLHAVRRFLDWCSVQQIDLVHVAPAHVGRYMDQQTHYQPATKKLHLSGLRHFFDQLVLRHVIVLNPTLSVRGERLSVEDGKTPEIPVKLARRLLDGIDCSTVVGLRDRAVIGIMIYTAVRVSAVAKLRRGDFYDTGEQYFFRMTEKRSKFRELPVRHDLCGYVLKYIKAGRLEYSDKQSPLFRTTVRRTKRLTQNPMTANDMSRMVKRRLADAEMPTLYSPHSSLFLDE